MNEPIGASELIITPQGAIYHLNLTPKQLADTIITVGDPDRVSSVSQYFDSIEHRAQHREFVTHTGTLNGKKISVVSTGIGPDNIDIVLNELDALANIDFETRTVKQSTKSLTIIRLGTSGSLQENIPVDSLVVSDAAFGLDNLLHYYLYKNTDEEAALLHAFATHTDLIGTPIKPYFAAASSRLSKAFQDGFHHGTTVTCPGFYGPQGRRLRAKPKLDKLIPSLTSFSFEGTQITNFEMETSAIFGLGNLLGHDCLSISAIVANRISNTFSTDAAGAVDKMIRQALEVISKL